MIASVRFKQHHDGQTFGTQVMECGEHLEAIFMSVDGYYWVRIS